MVGYLPDAIADFVVFPKALARYEVIAAAYILTVFPKLFSKNYFCEHYGNFHCIVVIESRFNYLPVLLSSTYKQSSLSFAILTELRHPLLSTEATSTK